MKHQNLTDQQIENRLKWVDALQCGKYNQTVGALKKVVIGTRKEKEEDKQFGYCCLGVVAEDLLNWKAEQNLHSSMYSFEVPSTEKRKFPLFSTDFLPFDVFEKTFGVFYRSRVDPITQEPGVTMVTQEDFGMWNDEDLLSFQQIAERIVEMTKLQATEQQTQKYFLQDR